VAELLTTLRCISGGAESHNVALSATKEEIDGQNKKTP
jgi:hypothetical protein